MLVGQQNDQCWQRIDPVCGALVRPIKVKMRSPDHYLHKFHGNQFVSSLLESFDDISNEPSLDAIRLDHDESTVGFGWLCVRHLWRDL